MAISKPSGRRLGKADIPVVFGMQKRGDREHDIAAWFGVNQGRVAEAKDGRYAGILAKTNDLPPKGPPGIKGRELFREVDNVIRKINSGADIEKIKSLLEDALSNYSRDEL